jgi:hypothetical protein
MRWLPWGSKKQDVAIDVVHPSCAWGVMGG